MASETSRGSAALAIILAAVLLGALFLPWIQQEGFELSGYHMLRASLDQVFAVGFGGLDWADYVFYAVPIAAVLTILIGISGGSPQVFALLAGVALWIVAVKLYLALMESLGGTIWSSLGVGAYAALASATLLVFAAMRR